MRVKRVVEKEVHRGPAPPGSALPGPIVKVTEKTVEPLTAELDDRDQAGVLAALTNSVVFDSLVAAQGLLGQCRVVLEEATVVTTGQAAHVKALERRCAVLEQTIAALDHAIQRDEIAKSLLGEPVEQLLAGHRTAAGA